MNKFKPFVLPVIVALLSLISLTDNLNFSNIPKLVVSVLGIIAMILFLLKNDRASLLIKIWIFAQFPYIVSEMLHITETGLNIKQSTNYWNTSQAFNLSLGFFFDSLEVKLNIIPFFYLGLYKLFKISNLIGKKVTITSGLKRENKLGNIFPLDGEFIGTLKFDDKSIWLITKLTTPLNYNGIEYENILLRPKVGVEFKTSIIQLSFLRFINPEASLDNLSNIKNDYSFIDFAGVKVN